MDYRLAWLLGLSVRSVVANAAVTMVQRAGYQYITAIGTSTITVDRISKYFAIIAICKNTLALAKLVGTRITGSVRTP
jgi:hypothetical protein